MWLNRLNELELKLISPEKEYYSGKTEMVVIPAEEGDFSAMKDHAPLVTFLRPGKIEIYNKEKVEKIFFVGSGFVKVAENLCLILVDYIKEPYQIDKNILQKELKTIDQSINSTKDATLLDKLLLKKKILEEECQLATN